MPGYRQAARDRDEAKRNRGSAEAGQADAVRKPVPEEEQAARDRDEAKRNRGSAEAGQADAVRKPVPEEEQAARDRDEAKQNRGSAGQVRRTHSENLYRRKGRPPATEMERSGIEVPRGRSGGRRRRYAKAASRRESE